MAKLTELDNEYLNIDTSSKYKIGAQIIERREALGISQSNLAKQLKISLGPHYV